MRSEGTRNGRSFPFVSFREVQGLVSNVVDGLPLIGAARRQLDDAVRRLSEPAGMPAIRYEEPAGDPGIFRPDSMTWRVHRNGGTLFIGGISGALRGGAAP